MHQGNRSHASYRRHLLIGPGGWRCSCCAPAPGKTRQRALKVAGRRWHRELQREERRLEDDDLNL